VASNGRPGSGFLGSALGSALEAGNFFFHLIEGLFERANRPFVGAAILLGFFKGKKGTSIGTSIFCRPQDLKIRQSAATLGREGRSRFLVDSICGQALVPPSHAK